MAGQFELNVPEAIDPVYAMQSLNQPIPLYSGNAIFRTNGKDHPCRAEVTFNWVPGPSVDVEVFGASYVKELTSSFFKMDLPDGDTSLELSERWQGIELGVLIIRPRAIDVDGKWSFTGTINNWPDSAFEKPAKAAIFHVANLGEYHGKPIQQNGSSWIGRGELNAGPWQITLDSLCSDDITKLLSNSGAYRITHVGKVTRSDGKAFAATDVNTLSLSLSSLLSFCNGRRCGPLLWIGYDDSPESPIWMDWRPTRTRPFQNVQSWWNEWIGVQPFILLGRVYRMFDDECWKETLRTCIYWYVEANRPGGPTEAAIVLSQLAFEGIADTLLVEDRGLISADGLKKLEAHDKLRIVLRTCGIPVDIPCRLDELKAVAKAENWDGADAIAFVRNCLVHPTKKNRDQMVKRKVTSAVRHQVRTLALHFLELTILSVLGYDGMFFSRMTVGMTSNFSPVPWSSGQSEADKA